MSGDKTVTELEVIEAPWNKQITVSEVSYDGGYTMLHLRIKEGRRFTDLELDAETAGKIAAHIANYSQN